MENSLDGVSEKFVEQMGLVFEAEGLPRISGKILGLLVIEGGPFSLSDISQVLQVSRGSVSTNTRLLEGIGMVERTSRPGDRQSFYQLAPDPYARLLRGSLQRMAKAHRVVKTAQEDLPKKRKDSQQRLEEFSNFYATFIDGYEKILDTLES